MPIILCITGAPGRIRTCYLRIRSSSIRTHREIQGIYREMRGYFFQFVDQMLTKIRILGL
jgi:hypothetical protein